MKIFNTKADLVAATLTAGQIVETKGYTTSGDGGGARYLIQTAAEFGGTPDEQGRSFTLANGNVALSLAETSNLLQFGADPSGVSLSDTAISAAITDSKNNTGIYEAPEGEYLIAQQHTFNQSGLEIRAVAPSEVGTEFATSGTRYRIQPAATPTSAFFFGDNTLTTVVEGINVQSFGAVIGNGLTKAFEFKFIRNSTFRNMLCNDVTRAYDQLQKCWQNRWEQCRAFDFDIGMRTDGECEDSIYDSLFLRGGRTGSIGWLSNFSAHVHTLINCDISNNEVDVSFTNSGTRTEMVLINCQLESGTVAGKVATFKVQSTDYNTSIKMIGGRVSNTSGVSPATSNVFNIIGGCESLSLENVKIANFATTINATASTSIKNLRINGVTEASTTPINGAALLSKNVDIVDFSDGSYDRYSLRHPRNLLDFDGSSGGSNTLSLESINAGAMYLIAICDATVPTTWQTGIFTSKGGFGNGTYLKTGEQTGSNTFTVSVAANTLTVTATSAARDAYITATRLT